MKKALIVLLALACVAGLAFADGATPSWSVANLYGFAFGVNNAGNTLVGWDYAQVGNSRTRLTFKYTAADGNVGFVSRLQFTGIVAGNMIWNRLYGFGKLFGGLLTVKGGILDDYTIATADWFNFGNADKVPGLEFILTPISGLNVAFYQKLPSPTAPGNGASANGDIVGLAYEMPNVVAVQAGAVLDFVNTAASGHQVYFGFNVTAVPNLTAILEANVSLFNGSTPIQLEENVGYTMGALTVGVRAGEYTDSTGFDWGVEPTVTYKVDDNLAVNAIVNVYNAGNSAVPIGTGVGNVIFYGPVDAGVLASGPAKTMLFGGGVFVTYTLGGFMLTVGDYYGADTTQGNLFYVNADVNL
jgi:hypothetical protein